MPMKNVLLSLTLLTAPLMPTSAHAAATDDTAAADELFVKADYEGALAAYRTAYKQNPDPELFIKMGRCLAQLGQNDVALASYERYLAEAPQGARRETVMQLIAQLKNASATQELSLDDLNGTTDAPAAETPAGEPFPEEATEAGTPPGEDATATPPANPENLPPPEVTEPQAPVVAEGPDPVVWVAVGAAAVAVLTGGAVAAAFALQPPAPIPTGDLGTYDLR
jgi:hypothetical protein